MTEGMKKFQLAFAGCVVEVAVKDTAFPDRPAFALAVKAGRVIRGTVLREKDQNQHYPRWQKVNEAQYINLALVQRFTLLQ